MVPGVEGKMRYHSYPSVGLIREGVHIRSKGVIKPSSSLLSKGGCIGFYYTLVIVLIFGELLVLIPPSRLLSTTLVFSISHLAKPHSA